MIRVLAVCVGPRYSDKWPRRLKSMVADNLSFKHEFVCVSDRDIEGITTVEAVPDLPGWWQKLALFQPGRFPGINLYLDLDVVIRGSLDPIVTRYGKTFHRLAAPDDFSYSLKTPKKGIDPGTRKLLGGVGTVNSSVMVWRDDAAADVWNKWNPDTMQDLHGDQNYITRTLYPERIELMDDELVSSYKYHEVRGLRQDAPVVVFHGNPKADQLPKKHELREIWESA